MLELRQLSARECYAITHSHEKWCIDADVKLVLRQPSAKTPASQEAIPASLEELRGWDPGCTLSFSSFSSPISVLKDEKARMHIVHPSFFILQFTDFSTFSELKDEKATFRT